MTEQYTSHTTELTPPHQKYLQERKHPSPADYSALGITRIDWVHMGNEILEHHNQRERDIIARLQVFIEAGFKIQYITDLKANIDCEVGTRIAIGGGLEDVCCELRKEYLKEAGMLPTIDLAMTTTY